MRFRADVSLEELDGQPEVVGDAGVVRRGDEKVAGRVSAQRAGWVLWPYFGSPLRKGISGRLQR